MLIYEWEVSMILKPFGRLTKQTSGFERLPTTYFQPENLYRFPRLVHHQQARYGLRDSTITRDKRLVHNPIANIPFSVQEINPPSCGQSCRIL